MKTVVTSALLLAASSSMALAAGHGSCATGLTLEENVLTIATGNPGTDGGYYSDPLDPATLVVVGHAAHEAVLVVKAAAKRPAARVVGGRRRPRRGRV